MPCFFESEPTRRLDAAHGTRRLAAAVDSPDRGIEWVRGQTHSLSWRCAIRRTVYHRRAPATVRMNEQPRFKEPQRMKTTLVQSVRRNGSITLPAASPKL